MTSRKMCLDSTLGDISILQVELPQFIVEDRKTKKNRFNGDSSPPVILTAANDKGEVVLGLKLEIVIQPAKNSGRG